MIPRQCLSCSEILKTPNIHPMLAKGHDKVEVLSTEEQEGGVEVVHFEHPAFRYFQASVIDPTSLSIESKVTGPLGIMSGHLKQMSLF